MTYKMNLVVPVFLFGILGYTVQGYSTGDRTAESSIILQKLDGTNLRQSAARRSDAGSTLEHFSHPDITQVITSRPGHSADFNVRQDPPPSEDDLQKNRRKREAEAKSEHERDDDSDMYMEPQDEESKEENQEESEAQNDKENEEVNVEENTKDNDGMSQHFFPSFAPVFSLGHSRPPQLFHQEPFYNKPRNPSLLRPEFNPFRAYRDSSFKVPVTVEDDATSSNILGSGNFGVIRGGTYYNDEEGGGGADDSGSLFNPYYSNNGHGRPYSENPRPQKYTNGDFFANFRDFADINTPTKASFSEYVIVYVNKNATKNESGEVLTPGETIRPKNIIEQLSLLDKEDSSENSIPQKKTSLHKRKLALLHQEKTNKQKKSYFKKKESPKDLAEPLLALS